LQPCNPSICSCSRGWLRLELDAAATEIALEQAKVSYLHNQEKLDYNHRVLSERNHESAIIITQQKRRLARLCDLLSRHSIRPAYYH
jgi:dynein regulatry complex protein 1